ncbi:MULTISPECIES: mechanosensitive ion channel domain-containing protein [unclassified Flavobacterium]|uniref:mechanosensitive ion channel family protein n=1 Tax=unclassified Flavobacterium TaxID=196869 RepID=UPI00086AD33E|nr:MULTISPECIES: mechanosensitive ion channel domain-containing protein [unclassified Flavobacterium]MBN9285662.1 mechanosensitive ion channel [Flavobacterium sp.]ODS81342.1 MAG: mechanosensitive ion channel protein MscS [Chryseobacterium sp. SCN 40-13]OJV70555.1 MAG: mechanosensitive ion channel protein MscS [Flavobacterium sp. 40-81]
MLDELKDILGFKLIDTRNIDFSVVNLIVLVVALMMTGVVLKFILKVITRKIPAEDKNKFVSVFQFFKYIVYLFVVMFTLHSSGVNMNVFLTASAALFVGIGLALQTFFQDIISGILMILDQSLHIGDIIEVDGKVGQVTEIRLRTTRAVTRNDRVMIIPNHKFMSETLFNWTQNNSTNRDQVSVGVAYGSDVRLVKKLLEDCVRETEGVLTDKEVIAIFEDFGDSALNFSVFFYVGNGMRTPRVQSEIRFKIEEAFRQHKISIPFPQSEVTIINRQNEA